MTTIAAAPGAPPADTERGYDHLLCDIQVRFDERIREDGPHLFTTDASGLFDTYLAALPEADRQHHTCHACRRFVDVYGGLAVIDHNGIARAAMWAGPPAPPYYGDAISAMHGRVARAKVTGVFYEKLSVWGTPVTPAKPGDPRAAEWTHFAAVPPPAAVFSSLLASPAQAMAAKAEDFRTLVAALDRYRPETVTAALRVLEADVLYRADKVIGPVRWLADLQASLAEARAPEMRRNLLWRAVAAAPAGFCHPRSSMAGTLMDDLHAGVPFDEVAARFAAKMRPDRYQRPQVAPAAGNIKQAEEAIAALGLAPSLERRFARLDEVETLWRPPTPPTPPTPPAGGGVFAHLVPKAVRPPATPLILPAATMTWVKFARDALPGAVAVEFLVSAGADNYAALVTAVHPDAPAR